MSPAVMSGFVSLVIEGSVRAMAAAGAIAAILFVSRVRDAALRHLAWRVAMVSMLTMPMVTSLLPGIAIPAPIADLAVFEMLPPPETDTAMPIASSIVSGAETPAPATTFAPAAAPAATGARKGSGWTWAAVLFGVYGAGLLILALRVWIGWRGQRRILARSTRIEAGGRLGDGVPLVESPLLATPVTVGIARPSIALPTEWRTWSDEKLRAVVAHEKTHVARRDPLVAFLSQVNTCVFWFHPLAWWLDRALSATAEQACDEAGVGEVRRAEHYAQILVDMANVVRMNRGRLRAIGVGVHGASLESRIDRVLSGAPSRVSRSRRAGIAVACAAVVFVVASCRQPSPSINDLQPDPALAVVIATQKARQERLEAVRELTGSDVVPLEAKLAQDPEDAATRETLLAYYAGRGRSLPEFPAAYRSHVLWLIAHHPDSDLLGGFYIGALLDPAGYLEAQKLWLPLIDKPDAPAAVLDNAAGHFWSSDQARAEQFLLRAIALEPKQPAGSSPEWLFNERLPPAVRLAQFYVETIARAESAKPPGKPDATAAPGQRFALAANFVGLDPEKVRRTLDTSKDETLLLYVASFLTGRYRHAPEIVKIGRSLAERVLQLNPQSARARQLLMPDRMPFYVTLTAFQRNTPNQAQYEAVAKMADTGRLAYLPELAERDYMAAESRDFAKRNDPDALARWQRSKRYAQDLLELLPRFKNDPNYGTAFYRANIALGLHALREGDGRTAVKYLLEASTAPRSDELAYRSSPTGLESRLVNGLLKYGDRDAVATFFDRTAQIRDVEKDKRLAAAAAIRKGIMPESFQRSLANGHV